ncbi:MAG: leucyl aminopeptidase [Acidimicrobiia bacterium]|nr:leucyl aminopeptidase [Acidimicrobiia bacterium]
MQITFTPSLDDLSGDLLILPVFADRTWGPGAEEVAAELGDWLDDYLEGLDFSGKVGQTAAVPGATGFGRVLFVGLGDEVDADGMRKAGGVAGRAALRYESVATTMGEIELNGAVDAFVYGFLLGQYKFTKYLSEPKPSKTETLVLTGPEAIDEVARAEAVAAGVAMARDLINEPAGGKKPEVMAEIAADMCDDLGMDITIYDRDEIKEEGFGGLLAVSLGATNPPRMVVMNYRPEGAEKTLALIGKGIVFDSGGLSIKPASAMETMKTDMSGAAAVFGAMRAIATLGLGINVVAITPLTENMTGGAALRPGDVFTARNGKTVEVLNTDAEGRLVLADGLSLAAEGKPDLMIDVATLTGAVQVALGMKVAGLFGSNDDAVETVTAAARRAGEKVWPLPLEKDYRSKLDSPLADIKNIGDRYAGAITAALFLAEFTAELPWAHLDIAGPARADGDDGYITKGGTGFSVATLVAVAEDMANSAVM